LKLLQLIQILSINAPNAAVAADIAAKVPGVNRLSQGVRQRKGGIR
jgi:hypothetical protein